MPNEYYHKCLAAVSNPEQCCELANKLPIINRLVIATLVSLLQRLCDEEIVKETKMDASNLAMVLAPNILRFVLIIHWLNISILYCLAQQNIDIFEKKIPPRFIS